MQIVIFAYTSSSYYACVRIPSKHQKCIVKFLNECIQSFCCTILLPLIQTSIVLDVCHQTFFICFPSTCLKSKHSCVSQSCDFDAHVIVDQIYIILKVAIILDLHIQLLKFELVCICIYRLHAKIFFTDAVWVI